MPAAPDATLQDREGRSVLRFERILPHPPERVWQALTEPTEHRSWHPTPFELEPEVGGKVTYLPSEEVPEMPAGEVKEYDPPRTLAHTWDEDLLRWELRAHDDGCLLVLTHTFADHFKAARDAAGWHVCLDALDAALRADTERPPSDWAALNAAYQERFGIAPEDATPVPAAARLNDEDGSGHRRTTG
jgi:uncharacterized protein YndB with AHSA1/START domain